MSTKTRSESRKTTAGSMPFSVRLTEAQRMDVLAEADKCGYSGSQFAEFAIMAVIDMIRQPAGKPVQMPKIIALARFIRENRPEVIVGK
jgi:hypothetical protein